ncbi:uncharacterized protein LY89DRAFT_713249 [Mollisia scopiformis]|uniref:Heterokaryon incompatibility domain-containing protein n=1 Tax=Mollisia scopiformis TaxID=149040 RepID=A0A194XW72_MOLSC|nr:uncharacterized protein LY89DRAFT_713249 [Mollisia scopiformis]KUJ24386.1 hypothetical protein LY89DRAFT_713249 [Mollisia scopiformis]
MSREGDGLHPPSIGMAAARPSLSSNKHNASNFAPLSLPRSIRLLRIVALSPEAGSPSQDPPVLGVFLEQFHLDQSPEYHALSYTWGEACRADIEDTDAPETASTNGCPTILVLENTRSPGEPTSEDKSSQANFRPQRKPYLITQNLQDGLQHLARTVYAGKWFWIDALCIDQENLSEKAIQVALMGEIYSKASKVIIWLGSDTKDLEEVEWLCNDYLIALSNYYLTFGMEDLRAQTPYSPKLLAHLNLQLPHGDILLCWEKYLEFCRRRRWLSRIWIVQEVALARDIVVECGETSLVWDHLQTLGRLIKALGWQPMTAPSVNKAFGRAICDEVIRLFLVKDDLGAATERLKKRGTVQGELANSFANSPDTSDQDVHLEWYRYLQRLLYTTRPYSATDARDKIFGLLGIAQTVLPVGMPLPIQPDYSEHSTAVSVYTSVSSMLLEKVSRSQNLSFVEDPGSRIIQGLPSWVPDYSVTLITAPLTLIRHPDHLFDCCPVEGSVITPFTIQQSTLETEGAVFDHIVAFGPPMWDVLKKSNVKSCLDMCKNIVQPYLDTNQDPSEVLWRTLIADTYASLPAAPSILASFKAWTRSRIAQDLTPDIISTDETGAQVTNVLLNESQIRAQLSFVQDLHDTIPALSLPTVNEVLDTIRITHRFMLQDFVARYATLDPNDPFPSRSEQRYRIEADAGAYHEALGISAPFRRLFRTERGFLGLGPQSAEVGDGIWLLKDAAVPFVLKAGDEDGTMRLVGECYLHGFMGGRMAQEVGGKVARIRIV